MYAQLRSKSEGLRRKKAETKGVLLSRCSVAQSRGVLTWGGGASAGAGAGANRLRTMFQSWQPWNLVASSRDDCRGKWDEVDGTKTHRPWTVM